MFPAVCLLIVKEEESVVFIAECPTLTLQFHFSLLSRESMRSYFAFLSLFSCLSFAASPLAEQQYLTCPDGRQIPTKLKGSREQRAATKDLKIDKVQKSFAELPGWSNKTDPTSLKAAIGNNCKAKRLPAGWKNFCDTLKSDSEADIHGLIEQHFTPYQLVVEGKDNGKFTSYYAPYINVSKQKSEQYPYALYRGSKTAKNLSRSQLDNGALPDSEALFWTDDYLDAFLLGVQGSGVGKLPDGNKVAILYHSKNTHNYVSIGKTLVQCGDVPASVMSLPAIKDWAAKSSEEEFQNLVQNNQSYVFFREDSHDGKMPTGALNVRLTAMRSIAVDKRYIPLGSMAYLSAQHPTEDSMIQRTFLAQDIGGAINGGIRADIFAGEGTEAEIFAGSMNHAGKFWMLQPN